MPASVPTLAYSSHPPAPAIPREPLQRELILLALLYVGLLAVCGPKLRLSQWALTPENHAVGEAQAWLSGRLDLPSRGGDVAEFNGRFYSHFPPLFTMISAAVLGLHKLILGEPAVFWGWLFVAIVALPVPALVYWVFRRRGLSAAWSALLAGYMIAGTCLWPVGGVLGNHNGAWIYSIQLILAQSGMAVFLIDLLGRRRIWLGGLGLLIAAWSRQTTILFAPALLWAAWRAPRRGPALLCALIPLAITAAVPMGLAWAKFGSPFESGYRYIYAGRDDPLATWARDADGNVRVFGWRYVPYNLYYYHFALPRVELTMQGPRIQGIGEGTSLWIGSPLLLLVLWDVRRWWRDATARALMVCSLLVNAVLMTYHYTGFDDPGYCRYTLDFTLVWLAVIAPLTHGERRTWFTLGCLAWSVYYFYMVT